MSLSVRAQIQPRFYIWLIWDYTWNSQVCKPGLFVSFHYMQIFPRAEIISHEAMLPSHSFKTTNRMGCWTTTMNARWSQIR